MQIGDWGWLSNGCVVVGSGGGVVRGKVWSHTGKEEARLEGSAMRPSDCGDRPLLTGQAHHKAST